MKTLRVVFFFALFGAFAAARTFPLTADNSVPAARGDVDVSHDDNGNTKIKFKVQFLSPPGELSPPASTYIIWIRDRVQDTPPEPIGILKIGKDRKGSFESAIISSNFDLFVTAEKDATTRAPTGQKVLTATIQP